MNIKILNAKRWPVITWYENIRTELKMAVSPEYVGCICTWLLYLQVWLELENVKQVLQEGHSFLYYCQCYC